MKIFNADQLAELDSLSCKEQAISSWELMERAAKKAYAVIKTEVKTNSVCLLAGSGNNGGDGLAIAYFLAQDGYEVTVYLVNYASSRSKDNQKNLVRLKNQSKVKLIDFDENAVLPHLESKTTFIDAIFGVGLNRPMPDFIQNLIKKINETVLKTIAIDVPSGMYINQIPSETEIVFKADITLTFQSPKLSFYLPDYSECIGSIKILDIGLSLKGINQMESNSIYVDLKYAQSKYNRRQRFSHKGTYGHALIVGGSQYMLGSVLLSSASCMRSGVGKTSVMMPKRGHSSLLHYLPEAMLVQTDSESFITYRNLEFTPQSIGIGVGIGQSSEALKALKSWLASSENPMVIDADALNLIANNKELLQLIPSCSILTPHPGELQKLIGQWQNDVDKLNKIKTFSKTWDVVVLAKDAYSLCVYKDSVYVNSTGNSGLATAGSGDVLTGLLTGLLAQGYKSVNAALLGAFLHGQAGDLALEETSEESLIASDIVHYMGRSFGKLKN